MIGTEFAGTLSKNLGTTLGKLDVTLKNQIYQLKDLAVQKAKSKAELELAKNIPKELKNVDPRNAFPGAGLPVSNIPVTNPNALNKIKEQSAQTQKIISICTKIKKALSQIQNPINKISAIINKITTIVILAKNILKILSALLKLLKANPTLPVAPPIPVISGPVGGTTVPGIPMVYPTSGANLTAGQVATKVQKFIDKAVDLLDSLSRALVVASAFLAQAVGLLQIIKPLLNSLCPDNQSPPISTPPPSPEAIFPTTVPESGPVISSNASIDNIINQLNNLVPKELIETEDSYKGYTFQVVEDKNQTTASGKVNKRYAIALNSQGIETFRSKASFATDKQILINELKFKIDNDLLNSSVQESV